MKKLILKELRLSVYPACFIFMILSAMLLIPNYPSFVGVSYFIFSVQIIFNTALANKDMEFMSMLPISRSRIVLSKHLVVVIMQLAQILFAIPCAIVACLVVYKEGNPIGMDANFAFFGFVFFVYGVFNITFFPRFFRTGTKAGVPLIFATGNYLLAVAIIEVVVHVCPYLLVRIDSLAPEYMVTRIIVLFLGIISYLAMTFISYRMSVKKFEKVSL